MKKNSLAVDKKRRVIATGIWATPVITSMTLPAHAQTTGPVFTAGDYALEFDNAGSNTVDCTGVNDGNTLTVGVVDGTIEVLENGTVIFPAIVSAFGTNIIENLIQPDGTIDDTRSFDFDDPVLGMCTTTVTVTGSLIGTQLTGSFDSVTTCPGCMAEYSSNFEGQLEN